MKRIVVLLTLGAALAAAAPASADFHGACSSGGAAGVGMAHAGGTFTYTGFVECPGATSLEITSLTLTRPDTSQDAAPPAACGPCDFVESSGDDAAGAPGTYRVRMVFNASGVGGSFRGVVRTSDFTWDGQTLTRVGPPPPPPPALALCDASQQRGAEVAFAHDLAPPLLPMRWSGAIVCHGIDEMQISELSVQRRAVNGSGPLRRADVSGARCAGCSTLSAEGSAGTEGPGTYRVTMRYALRRGTDVRSATVQRDFTTLGAGPALP